MLEKERGRKTEGKGEVGAYTQRLIDSLVDWEEERNWAKRADAVSGRRGPELQPFPLLPRAHSIRDSPTQPDAHFSHTPEADLACPPRLRTQTRKHLTSQRAALAEQELWVERKECLNTSERLGGGQMGTRGSGEECLSRPACGPFCLGSADSGHVGS